MDLVRVVDLLAKLAVILGVPAALVQYCLAKRREKRDREYGTYNALDDKYIEFQRLCLRYPYLDVFDVPDSDPAELNKMQKKEELIVYTILFSIFERAFLMYSDQSTRVKRRQWTGWEEYIAEYCSRENFRDAWAKSGTTFDTRFQQYMTQAINKNPPEAETQVAAESPRDH
jgi:hypothetical protein